MPAAPSQLAGDWLPAPITLAAPQVAIVSDACATAARESLGEFEANLPTILVDARGAGVATAILADDLLAIVCFAQFSGDGASATVDSVSRLSSTVLEPLDAAKITVDEVARLDEDGGVRTVAFGRVGPDAGRVTLDFDTGPASSATVAEGWWAAWWPGTRPVGTVSALDASGTAIASAHAPAGLIEARVGRAAWWLDPNALEPTVTSTAISALVLEEACASGQPGRERVDVPDVVVSDSGETVTLWIRMRTGAQDCQGNEPFPYTLHLPEALGSRTLFDGGDTPPREAARPPTG